MNTTQKPRKTRIGISPRTRFNVFKRDGFKCQYCGACPPDVVLVVDHILPVVAGGTNDIENLVSACKPCNAGKAGILLSVTPKSLDELAKDVATREAMIRDHADVLFSSKMRKDADVQSVSEIFLSVSSKINNMKLGVIRSFNERIGVDNSCDAMRIAVLSNKVHTPESIFRYYCGVCRRMVSEMEVQP